jgi:hypothetical protein
VLPICSQTRRCQSRPFCPSPDPVDVAGGSGLYDAVVNGARPLSPPAPVDCAEAVGPCGLRPLDRSRSRRGRTAAAAAPLGTPTRQADQLPADRAAREKVQLIPATVPLLGKCRASAASPKPG